MNARTHDVPIAEIRKQLGTWNRSARRLRALSFFLGITAIVASILVASNLFPTTTLRVLAVVAAIATTALTGLDRTHKSNGFRSAWRELNAALMRHDSGIEPDDQRSIATLIDAYAHAETLIGDITVKPG
jgi:hypothetical protein